MSQPVPKSKTQPPKRRFLKISFVVPRDWGRDLERLKREKKCVTTSELMRRLIREAAERGGEK